MVYWHQLSLERLRGHNDSPRESMLVAKICTLVNRSTAERSHNLADAVDGQGLSIPWRKLKVMRRDPSTPLGMTCGDEQIIFNQTIVFVGHQACETRQAKQADPAII